MTATLVLGAIGPRTVAEQQRAARREFAVSYGFVCGLTLLVGVCGWLSAPGPLALAVSVMVVAAVATLARPVNGLYVLAFFTLIGDGITSPWFPVVKNFSSQESMLYLADALIVSPFELFLGLTVLSWLLHQVSARTLAFRHTPLTIPLVVFTGFVVLGLVTGLGSGGNTNAGLWEARPLLYLPVLFVLATSLLTEPKHYQRLVSLLLAGIVLDAVLGVIAYSRLSDLDRATSDSLGEHGASLHINLLLVLVATAWVYRGCTWRFRLVLPLGLLPVVFVYLQAQRRAAFLGLAAGLIVALSIMLWTRRRTFFVVAPVLAVVSLAYLGAFWNSSGSLGSPAQAVKGVVAPGQQSAEDQSSDVYRIIESVDIVTTIRAKPITGIGFGQKFYTPIPLPDISSFVYYQYATHNAILWIWMKVGVFGFITMLYLLSRAIQVGTRAARRLPGGDLAAMTLASTAFVLMFGMYAYVDIAWDVQTVALLAMALALVSTAERVHGDPRPTLGSVERR